MITGPTPGHFRVVLKPGLFRLVAASGREICEIYGNNPVDYANAVLLAAAPRLLAAANAFVAEADLGELAMEDEDRAKIEELRAAIASASLPVNSTV